MGDPEDPEDPEDPDDPEPQPHPAAVMWPAIRYDLLPPSERADGGQVLFIPGRGAALNRHPHLPDD